MGRETFLMAALPMPAGDDPPEWIVLVPQGDRVMGVDGRVVVSPGLREVLAQQRRYDRMLPIDVNHASQLAAWSGQESPAQGWITDFMIDEEAGLRGRVEWTQRGMDALARKDYRYHSPALITEDGMVMYVESAALVNIPNLKLAALNSARKEVPMGRIQTLLGIPDDANEDDTLRALQARLPPAGGAGLVEMAPKADLQAALQRAQTAEQGLQARDAQDLATEAEAVVEEALTKRLTVPASKEFFLAMAKESREGLERVQKHFATLTPVVGTGDPPSGDPPEGGDKNDLTPDAQEVNRQLGIDGGEGE